MNRPYVVVLLASSVDGRISLGPNRTMFEEMSDPRTLSNSIWNEIEDRLKSIHKPQINMLGSNTLVKEGEKLKSLPAFEDDEKSLYQDFLPEEIVNRSGHEGWLCVVDGRGRFRNGYKGPEDNPGWHSLHLVSNNVSAEYLAFLQRERIPYLISGEKRVDLKSTMKKIKTKLEVDCVLVTGGGKLSGALLREGFVDEVNIIVQPQLIGGFNTPCLFDSPDLKSDENPTSLKLIAAQVQSDGFLWLRYEVMH